MKGMEVARRLYEKVGFRRLPAPMGATGHHRCDRYYALDLG
jgi:putative acetyltransferase